MGPGCVEGARGNKVDVKVREIVNISKNEGVNN